MNNNLGVGGGFLSGSNCGFLDLESSNPRHQQTQMAHPSNTHHHNGMQLSSLNMMAGLDDDQAIGFMEVKGLNTPKAFSMSFGKGKAAASVSPIKICGNSNVNMSDEDEPSYEDGNDGDFDGGKGKKGSPWQRMKWTDSIVRLLIQVVACVGDDGSLEGMEGMKRRSGSSQKKGKWKTVSKIMIAKGSSVSPQQCEDKFNDLNKRYKRLNDILGRGTSCRVVENPAIMDSMHQLSPKMKDDVRKILSSKHLFYPEMCAYHNGQRIPNCSDLDLPIHSLPLGQCSKENNVSEAEEVEEHDDSEDDESDHEDNDNGGEDLEKPGDHGERKIMGDEDDGHIWSRHGEQDGFQAEIDEFFLDPKHSQRQKTEWVKKRMLQLQEQRVGIHADAFEMEKRRFKWQIFCNKKDRELEITRLENERLILENERMALLLKQKEQEIELNGLGPLVHPASLSIDRPQGRDHIDVGRHQ